MIARIQNQALKLFKNGFYYLQIVDYFIIITLNQQQLYNNLPKQLSSQQMVKKQNQSVAKHSQTPIPSVQVETEDHKQQILQKATKALQKFLPHEKYIIRKTKLITKKKNEAIEFLKLDKFQVAKAIECLKKFDSENKPQVNLFTQDGFIYLQLDLSKVPEHYSIRPVQIELPHPIYSKEFNSRFTIFTTDPESNFTQKIQSLDIPQIADVIGYEKVKKQLKENKDKLKLISGNEMFFCDWKIYNLLRQPLGKAFYDKKKYPFPIDCQDVPQQLKTKFSTYQEYLNDLSNHTYFMMGNGPVYSLKIGRISMETSELVKNIMRGVYRVIPHILTKDLMPSVIRQITIKTFNSPCLPIYNYLGEKEAQAYKVVEGKISSSAKTAKKVEKKVEAKTEQKSEAKGEVKKVESQPKSEVKKVESQPQPQHKKANKQK